MGNQWYNSGNNEEECRNKVNLYRQNNNNFKKAVIGGHLLYEIILIRIFSSPSSFYANDFSETNIKFW